jgi:hypothetical protein
MEKTGEVKRSRPICFSRRTKLVEILAGPGPAEARFSLGPKGGERQRLYEVKDPGAQGGGGAMNHRGGAWYLHSTGTVVGCDGPDGYCILSAPGLAFVAEFLGLAGLARRWSGTRVDTRL